MLLNRVFSLLVVVSFLAACSNDDDGGSTSSGNNVFLHLVGDAAQLRLEGKSRNFSTLRYEQFSSSISVKEGTYRTDVVEVDQQNFVNNEILVEGTVFRVTPRRNRLQVLHGSVANNSVEVTTITLARDEDSAKNDNDENLYINVTHLYHDDNLSNVDVYFVEGGGDIPDAASPVTLSFGETSGDIIFDQQSQELIVTETGNKDAIVFRSGRKVIYDAIEQGIVLGNHVGAEDSTMNAYYYAVFNAAEIWNNQLESQNGYVKIVNALVDSRDEDDIAYPNADVAITDGSTLVDSVTVNYGTTSEYMELAASGYSLGFDDLGGFTPTWTFTGLSVGADSTQTVYLYGTVDANGPTLRPIVFNDDKRALSNYAALQLVHLSPAINEDSSAVVDIHITNDGFLDATTLVASGLQFGGSSSFYVRRPDSDSYTLAITRTEQLNTPLITLPLLDLAAGDSRQFMLYNTIDNADNISLEEVTEDIPAAP